MFFSRNTRVSDQFVRFTGEWLNRRPLPAEDGADRERHGRARREEQEGTGALGSFARKRCRSTPLLAYDLTS